MITVRRYKESDKEVWNEFNSRSKNSLFMFNRDFMDYHKDRFQDHSLMFFNEKDELIAILPLNEKETTLSSHGGLTYGGFIVGIDIKQHHMNDCFVALLKYARENSFKEIFYKIIPHIFHEYPTEEDRYSLFLNNAQLIRVEPSTIINLGKPLKMPKGRKAQISRAKREGVVVVEMSDKDDYVKFIDLENQVLAEHHDTKAVHTGDELALLNTRFPENVRLFGAIKNNELIAGTVVFEYKDVVHTQYMAANHLARQIGALDLVVSTVIEKYKHNKKWLDFGISTENGGRYLNEGLIAQKEGFGGRTNTYEMWKIILF